VPPSGLPLLPAPTRTPHRPLPAPSHPPQDLRHISATAITLVLQVAGDQVHTLEATWGSSSTGSSAQPSPLPMVRLAGELPTLELRAKDDSGRVSLWTKPYVLDSGPFSECGPYCALDSI
jgi:hypothetical protein